LNERDRKVLNFINYDILQVNPTRHINFEDVRTQRRIILEQILKIWCDNVGWINPAQIKVQ
jgi:hypothetical protein